MMWWYNKVERELLMARKERHFFLNILFRCAYERINIFVIA